MKNPMKSYVFWLKIVSAALLVAFGIWLLVDKDMAVFIVLMFTGMVAAIFALIRVIPLIKTLKSTYARYTCVGEIIIHLIVAALLIVGAISIVKAKEDGNHAFADFMRKNYRFIIAFFFETRVVSYFMCTVLFKEETDKIKFWVHILLLVLGCLMCSLYQLNAHVIAIIIAVIALLCSVGLIADGGISYGRYRKGIAKEREEKQKDKKEEQPEEKKDTPGKDDVVIPMGDEPSDQDSTPTVS